MRKIGIVLLLCFIGWISKLSYDFYQISQQYALNQQQMDKLEKQNNKLNDQLAALQRSVPEKNVQTTGSTSVSPAVNAVQLIQQKIDLVEFALSQQQTFIAIEQLQQLNAQIEDYALAPALQQSLHQVIAKDIGVIQQYAMQTSQQQLMINEALDKVDVLIAQELKRPHLDIPSEEKAYFWQKWFKAEKTPYQAVDLKQRSLILKEVQLRLLLLRQLVLKNQTLAITEELKQIEQLFQQLPDQKSQSILFNLKQLKKIEQTVVPQLNTRTLLG